MHACMQADVVDWDALGSGVRREGAFFAWFNFLAKGGGSAGALAMGGLLDAAGFVPNVTPQPLRVQLVLSLLFGLPVLGFGAAIAIFRRYDLDEEHVRRAVAVAAEQQQQQQLQQRQACGGGVDGGAGGGDDGDGGCGGGGGGGFVPSSRAGKPAAGEPRGAVDSSAAARRGPWRQESWAQFFAQLGSPRTASRLGLPSVVARGETGGGRRSLV